METPFRLHKTESWEFEYKTSIRGRCARWALKNTLTAALILGGWYLAAAWVQGARNVAFPTPGDVCLRLFALLQGETLYEFTLYEHFFISLKRWAAAYILAAAAGVGAGACMGLSKTAKEIVMPIVYFLQLIPGLAWIPIALLLFGIGGAATIFMIFITALPPIVINVAGGVGGIPEIYFRASKMMGATRRRIFTEVMIPAALIPTINGLRIGLANGWRVLIAAEMVVGLGLGLGYSIIQSRWSLDFESSFVCIALICLTGLFFEKVLFNVIEAKIARHVGA